MTASDGSVDSFRVAANPPGSLPFPTASLPPLPPKWSAPAADAPAEGIWANFDQTKIRCTMSACGDGLHCFRLTKKLAQVLGPGTCRECHQILVSLQRTGQRDLSDLDHTFAALQVEAIRHYFWHAPFGQKARDYALRAGRLKLRERVPCRIRSRIGKAQPFRDGTQTPILPEKADAIDFALHAVAACCRKCANYWHGIELDRPLSESEISYLAELAWRYLDARLPSLPDHGQRVPRRRVTPSASGDSNVTSLPSHVTPPIRHLNAS
jgi:hypothetical protein